MHVKRAAAALVVILLAALLSACSGSSSATTTVPAPTDGAALLQARCVACHTLDRVTSQQRDQAWWEATVARMVNRGADLTEAEQATLVAYLAETYGP